MRSFSALPARARLWQVLLACLLALAGTVRADGALPKLTLDVGGRHARVEVAATEAARRQGLMHRRRLAADEGMLFVFDLPAIHCMWMKNTHIPLSVAFADGEGVIINIADMAPNSTDSHCARAPARYALEMPQGWFRRHGIGPGAEIRILRPPPEAAPKTQ